MAMDFLTVTTQFVAGTKARASEINANLSDITDSLSDSSKDIYIGGLAKGIASTNATMTIADDCNKSTFIINNTTTASVVTLPTASANTGRVLTIKKGGQTEQGGKITLKGEAAGETIDGISGATGIDILNQFEYVTVQCDGADWFIIDHHPGRAHMPTHNPTVLDTDHLLNNSDLPSTGGTYGWHGFSGEYANAAALSSWIGSNGLTAISVNNITTTTNHLGDDSALDLDGTNDGVFLDTTTADTANENFTIGKWCKLDRSGSNEYLMSKYLAVNTGNSFYLKHSSNGDINFNVYYDNAGSAENIKLPSDGLTNGSFHHIVLKYESDTAASNMGIWIDSKCRGYLVSSNLANRNNTSTSKLTWSGYGNGTVNSPVQGQMDDMFYAQTAMSADSIRKIYSAGSRKYAIKDGSNKVSIVDSCKNNGYYRKLITADGSVNTVYSALGNGWETWIPEDGEYEIKAEGVLSAYDAGSADNRISVKLHNNTDTIDLEGTARLVRLNSATNSSFVQVPFNLSYQGYFSKDDHIEVWGWEQVDSSGQVQHDAAYSLPYVMWEKLD